MKKTILNTGVKVLNYQSFGSEKMKVENNYLKKYSYCNGTILNYLHDVILNDNNYKL